MASFTLHRGSAPLLISLPHNGTELPAALRPRLTAVGCRIADTDWHMDRLYDFAGTLAASLLMPRYSRYLIDLNRPPDGAPLYPGQTETGLVPMQSFAGQQIYRNGCAPDADEIAARRDRYWWPYHQALAGELERLRRQHGQVLLWEGHSIRSELPLLFDGRLPDLNLGTASGASCGARLQAGVVSALQAQTRYSLAVNGRFKGGYITRHYGRPEQGVHAIQMEIAQCNYLDENRFTFLPDRAQPLQQLLAELLRGAIAML
ncbi:MAG: N-formylglutamate deformylase [Lysobacterales bacterium]